MKKIFLLGLVIGLALSLSSAAYANIVVNPGFEQPMGNGMDPLSWWGLRQYPSTLDVEMKTSTAEKHSDSQSGRITMIAGGSPANLWAGYGQQFTIGAGVPFTSSAWLKCTDDYGTTAKLQIEFKNINGDEINRTYVTSPNGAFDWTQLSTAATTPAGTEAVLLNLLVEKGTGSGHGTFYWDDAQVDVVPEPTSLLLLGSGLFGMFAVSRRKK